MMILLLCMFDHGPDLSAEEEKQFRNEMLISVRRCSRCVRLEQSLSIIYLVAYYEAWFIDYEELPYADTGSIAPFVTRNALHGYLSVWVDADPVTFLLRWRETPCSLIIGRNASKGKPNALIAKLPIPRPVHR